MLTVVKNYMRFIFKSIKCNFLSILEYKKSFVIQCLFMFMNNLFFLIFWMILFRGQNGEINGITFNDILYLWSIPVMAYGISFFFFGGIMKLGKYILEGGLDTFLIQPKNVIINVMVSGMEFAAAGDLLYGLLMGLFAVKFNIFPYLILIGISFVAAIFYICTEAIIRLLTIWIGNTDNVEHIYMNTLLITFSTYPEKIYGNGIKLLLYTIVPSAYIAFIPIKLVNTLDIKYLVVLIVMAIVYILATILLAKKAFKKYESGNNIALKM